MGVDALGDDAHGLDFSLLHSRLLGRRFSLRAFSHLDVGLGRDGIEIPAFHLLGPLLSRCKMR